MLLHQNIKAFRSHFLPSGQHVYLAEAWRFVKVVLNAKCQAYFKNQFGRVNSCHRVSPNCLENRMFPSLSKHLRYSFLRELGRVCGMCCTLVVEGWHHAPGTSAVSFDHWSNEIKCPKRCSSFSSFSSFSSHRLEGGSLQTRRRRCKLPQGASLQWFLPSSRCMLS